MKSMLSRCTILSSLLLTFSSCTNSDNGYLKCLQYCNEENVIVFYWTIKTEQKYTCETTNWRFGMCRTPSDETAPTKDEINTMHNTMCLTIQELATLLNETNHIDNKKISLYWTKKNMNDTEYSIWKYNYPMEAGFKVEKVFFEALGPNQTEV